MASRTLVALFLGLSLFVEAQTAHQSAAAPAPKPTPDEQLCRNATFGFRYKIPYGWVERTRELREQAQSASAASAEPSSSNPAKPDSEGKIAAPEKTSAQGEVLLAIFERPPDAPGDSINSAVVIVSESAAAYPGLKKAEDYLGLLGELTAAKGFKADGDPGVLEIDSRQLIRADFSRPLGATKDDKLTMHQSTLVLLAKGQIVSFTFIAATEDEIDDLIDALHFGAANSPAH
jgi:hypothetical protein